jgi:calcium/calmodulin-dependent protein kinase I
VRKGKNRASQEKVAIKILSKRKMKDEDVLGLQNEIGIMSTIDHPNVVKLVDTYEDKGHYCLIMELMQGGELFDQLIEKDQLDEKDVHALMVPVFDAVIYCHAQGIVHRDIKPENLLLTDKNAEKATVKVSDFGLARTFSEDNLCGTTAGTPGYVAPEIVKKAPYDHRCDYWSLAVTLYVLLSGSPPFWDEDNFVLFDKIKAGKFSFEHPVWKNVSNEGKDFIAGLLVVNPDDRMDAGQI